MGIKSGSSRIIDLRKAPKDIVESVRKSEGLGEKIEALGKVRRKLTGFLRSNVLKV
ncbi:hypothetical protein LCGC14_2875070 [marine sediment metagenome]|uniref:Uncharacterized protein n=1 Tax=marine sediment metagenome TaxID=412755 RepID=A0A0F8Y1Y0_9ZZZZ